MLFEPIRPLLALLVTAGAASMFGCGGDENEESRPQQRQPATTGSATTPADPDEEKRNGTGAGTIGRGHAEGNPNGTYTYSGSTRGVLKLPASPEAQLALLERAKRSPRNRAAGCRLYTRGKRRQWGPAPPRIKARLEADGLVVVTWRFRGFPDSLACKPFNVVIGVSKGRPGTPKFTSLLFDYRLHSLSGESRQRTLPYLTDPPYDVSVAGESVHEVQGPPATARVDR